MENESSDRDGAAGLGNRSGVSAQIFHRLADFIFGHGNDLVHITADMLEIDRANTLRSQAVGDGTQSFFRREFNNLARSQAGLRIGG